MFLFAFLILPIFLAWYCFYKKNSKILPSILIGIVCAVVLCLILALFTFSHRIVPYDFPKNLTHLLLTQTVLPLLVPYLLFVIFSKDNLEYKMESFLPLSLSFFAVYLPFIILTTAEGLYSGFSLFIKPILFERYFCIFLPFLIIITSILLNYDYRTKFKPLLIGLILFLSINMPKYENFYVRQGYHLDL